MPHSIKFRASQAREGTVWFLLAALWIAGLWAGRNGGGGDLGVLWHSTRSAFLGDWNEIYLRNSSGPFFYPPIALLVLAPFGWFPTFETVTLFSLLVHSVFYWGFWWGVRRLFPDLFFSGTPFWRWGIVFAAAIAPLHLDFMGQNIQGILAGVLILLECALRSGNRATRFFTGVASGIFSLVKLFPVFVTATYLFRKDKDLRCGIIVGWVLGVTLPFAVFGLERGQFLLQEFVTTLTIYHDKNLLVANPGVLNFPALIATWFQGFEQVALLVTILPVFVGFFFFGWLARVSPRPDPTHVWALSVALMAFLNSASRPEYFIFFVPAFAALMVRWDRLRDWERVTAGLAFALMALTQQAMVGKTMNVLLESWRLPVVGMALLAISLWSSLEREGKRRGASVGEEARISLPWEPAH